MAKCDSVIQAVSMHAKATPDKIALIDQKSAVSYKELLQRCRSIAAEIHSWGVVKGDRVLVQCTQDIPFMVYVLACEMLEVIIVPLEKDVKTERLIDIYDDTQAFIAIVSENHLNLSGENLRIVFNEKIERADVENEGECAFDETGRWSSDVISEILFSTGTTGKPKGIMITNGNNVAIAENVITGTEMTEDSIELISLPLSHSHALRSVYAHLVNGSTALIADGISDISGIFYLMEKWHVNAMDISPAIAKILFTLAASGLKKIAGQIEYIQVGTTVLDDSVRNRLIEMFPTTRIYDSYGSTEAGRSCVLEIHETAEKGCVGHPTVHSKFIIVDVRTKCQIVSTAEHPGIIAVSGGMVTPGYWNNPELTNSEIIDRTLYSSDLGYLDEEGRLYVYGRIDDVICYKGIKIMPEEIETVANGFSGIADCACIALEDELCGQVPYLLIKLEEGCPFSMREFERYLGLRLEKSRMPRKIEMIDEIPRTANGKLQRNKLTGRRLDL